MSQPAGGSHFDSLALPCEAHTDSHLAWRSHVRAFVDTEIAPCLDEWQERGSCPDELFGKAAEAGILGAGFAPELGGTEGEFDLYHRIITAEELHRLGTGVVFADLAAHWIGLPPVISHGSPEMRERVAKPVLRGEKKVAFAVTEPSGGSDVAQLRARAERDGDDFIVNGHKMLISGGMRADFLLVAVRTGEGGTGGLSMLLIETDREGIEREPVAGIGWYNSNVAHIHFNDVRVPVSNLIGEENRGFAALAGQFNVERFSGIASALAMGRTCAGEAIAWTQQRETFGAPLAQRQVVRHKIVDMASRLRCAQSYLYHCAARFQRGEQPVADLAMLKVQATSALEFCTRETLQLLGGHAYTGENRVERMFREARMFVIGGGADEILKDFVARQLAL